jgi:AcrR family transcriptional regulator
MSKEIYHHGNLRQALLNAALMILEVKDSKELSLREVAKKAGVSHTAPYRHFDSKIDLLATVAEKIFAEFIYYLRKIAAQPDTDAIQSLRATETAYVRYALEHPNYFRIMLHYSTIAQPSGSNVQLASKKILDVLLEVIEVGQMTGIIKLRNPNELALERWALIHGLSILLLDGFFPFEGDSKIDQVHSIITDSLGSITVKPSGC